MKKLSQEQITDKLHQDHVPRVQNWSGCPIQSSTHPCWSRWSSCGPTNTTRASSVIRCTTISRPRSVNVGWIRPPPITRRPGETYFIIRNGGNTRLAILSELWQETRDERFFRIHCLFRPWSNEITALLGHLTESDLHGQLTFIERALAVAKLKTMLEADGTVLSQRELARRLTAGGYPISQSQISRMLDTLEHLLPAIPQTLYAGLGKPQIERLIALRSQAERTWNRYPTATITFAEFWLETLVYVDADPESFDLEQLQDELLERMSRLLGQSYRMLALELSDTQRVISTPGIVVTTPSENNHLSGVDVAAAGAPSSEPIPNQRMPDPRPNQRERNCLHRLERTSYQRSVLHHAFNRFVNRSIARPPPTQHLRSTPMRSTTSGPSHQHWIPPNNCV